MGELGGLDTDVVWRLGGDFRLRRGKWAALHSDQSPCSNLFLFSLGARTTLPPSTAGTVVHPRAGENTQILGTYSVGPLTTQKRKESEEPWLLGSSQGITLGKSPALMSRVKYSHAWGPRKSGFHVIESKELPPDLLIREVQVPGLFDVLFPEAQGEGMSWVLRGCLSRAAP